MKICFFCPLINTAAAKHMLSKLRLPRTLLWVLNVAAIYIVLFTFFRVLTLLLFKPEGDSPANFLSSFFLGLRFDLRWISILLLPIVAASTVQQFSPYYGQRNQRLWTWYLAISSFFVFLIYAIDFGCFSYFRVRLGATVLNFADDAAIATQMLWEMYPLFWMVAALVMTVLLLRYVFYCLHKSVSTSNAETSINGKWLIYTNIILMLFVYGGFPGPLKWDAAFQQKNDFGGYLSLNPLQSVYSTLQFRNPQFDSQKAKEAFPVMQDWLGWPTQHSSYERKVAPVSSPFSSKPNVVLVVCESFSMYKTSMSGNKLQTTPFFKSLCDSGVFFNRCFSPHFSTARGMFAITTGIPDVQLAKFSTRTEAAFNQHSIINDFNGYEKYYFLGGSASFNNFEGLMRNIDGVKMMTEGDFSSKPIDVWGISDKNLFLEANRIFAGQQKPFFAVIQTSDNHPPYTIAEEDKDFQQQQSSPDILAEYGFESLAQYNAIRYFDYSVQKFMNAAKKQAYFNNTLFVFVGDHGVAGNASNMYSAAWTNDRLTEMHVPMLFYAPGRLQPQLHTEVVSQIDVLPTVAALAGQQHTNTTLGRNLLQPGGQHGAFFIRHDESEIGLITDDFYFSKNILFDKEKLVPLGQPLAMSISQQDSVQRHFSKIATAYLETARWMLMHNKKNRAATPPRLLK